MEASSTSTSTSTGASVPAPQQIAFRSPVPHSSHPARPPSSTRTPVDMSNPFSMPANAQRPTTSDVWAGAIARVQQQVAYNTSLLESHRRQMHDMDQAIRRLHTDFSHAVGVINDFRVELREARHRPVAKEPSVKHDSGDLDVLANQIAVITSKANEVEGLKMQLELLRNRIKRMEQHGPLSNSKPESTSVAAREQAVNESHHLVHQQPQHLILHQALPPLRAAALSSRDDRGPAHRHVLQRPPTSSQGPSPYLSSTDPRHYAVEVSHASSPPSKLRPSESTLPSSTALSGWRPEEGPPKLLHHPKSFPDAPSGASSMPPLPHNPDTEHQSSGWASVNQQSLKRSFEDPRNSPHESVHTTGSPKRTKLAPIMPRGDGGEERYSSHQPPLAKVITVDRPHARSSAPVDGPLHLTQPLAIPVSASMNAYRFIPSSQHTEAQEVWQSAPDHAPVQSPGRGGRGRGRGGRARGRPREGVSGSHQHHHREEHVVSRGEEAQWQTSPTAHNGHHNPMYVMHSSPGRSGLVRRSGGAAGGQPGREHLSQPPGEYPASTIYGIQDPFQPDGGSSKKSRTKPIRNSDGILIRKDGRPDMRSVSSANNLRKVHAKKEAERTDTDGRTPTSVAADDSQSPEDDDHARDRLHSTPAPARHVHDTRIEAANGTDRTEPEGRTRELMNKIFPHGYDGTGRMAEPASPHMSHGGSIGDVVMKTETLDTDERRGESPRPRVSEPFDTRLAPETQHSRPPEARMAVVAESTEL